jgi:hypothetical protein
VRLQYLQSLELVEAGSANDRQGFQDATRKARPQQAPNTARK